eukprot:5361040-Prymnesium_polylepis.1
MDSRPPRQAARTRCDHALARHARCAERRADTLRPRRLLPRHLRLPGGRPHRRLQLAQQWVRRRRRRRHAAAGFTEATTTCAQQTPKAMGPRPCPPE